MPTPAAEREAGPVRPAAGSVVTQWNVWIDPVGRPGPVNMARDQALLEQVTLPGHQAYLRLYRWDPPCLSLGRNEPARTRYDRTCIERLHLAVVRRPTGGRAVWHEDEVTYAVAAPIGAFGCLADSYRAIHQRLARALALLGAPVELAPAIRPARLAAGACFAQPVGGELVLAGRKLAGSAQVQQGAGFLQHGSILLGGSQEVVARVSRQGRAPAGGITLSEALGRTVTFEEVAQAILATWADPGERLIAHPGVPVSAAAVARFADPDWTWRR